MTFNGPDDSARCWCCGLHDPAARRDEFMSRYRLCDLCWPYQPPTARRGARDGAALVVALSLPRMWWGGIYQRWTQTVAANNGITCWIDCAVPERPAARFDWLTADRLGRASDALEQLLTDFERQRIPPAAPAPRQLSVHPAAQPVAKAPRGAVRAGPGPRR
ncbi:hypothetical protein OHU23_41285 (plasmid) [Streptomyces virginiae]|uniref:hypothetical protein n=1 Tax=Streptomyces virginiae TaxID=1961 RepID=UPI003253F6A8